MKKIAASLAIIATLTLTGCSTPEGAGDNSNGWYLTTLNDPITGGKVLCAINGYSNQSGITCDWGGAK